MHAEPPLARLDVLGSAKRLAVTVLYLLNRSLLGHVESLVAQVV